MSFVIYKVLLLIVLISFCNCVTLKDRTQTLHEKRTERGRQIP